MFSRPPSSVTYPAEVLFSSVDLLCDLMQLFPLGLKGAVQLRLGQA